MPTFDGFLGLTTPWRRWIILALTTLTFFLIYTGSHFQQQPGPKTYGLFSASHLGEVLGDVANRTLGFERIFVINLPTRTDHRDAFALAAALSDIHVDFVDGVEGNTISENTLPPGAAEQHFPPGVLGCWRAHMNVLEEIVAQNISSALILEDDADWDVRIKSQLETFARASQVLTQPLQRGGYLDSTFPDPEASSEIAELTLGRSHDVVPAQNSPYGDEWEVLWLGHCGTRFPQSESDPGLPKGRVVIANDDTVISHENYGKEWGSDDWIKTYAEHMRVVHHAAGNVCTLAYAVTQKAAQRLLYEVGLQSLTGPYDMMLRNFCDKPTIARKPRTCLTVQPQLFNHHRPKGNSSTWSNIAPWKGEDGQYVDNDQPYTLNIRWSTRVNVPNLLNGDANYIDSFPDRTDQ